MAVCHHHAPAIMPFCHRRQAGRAGVSSRRTMGEEAPFWDQHDEFGDTNLLVVKPEEGQSLARALGKHSVVMMNRHGATVVGGRLKEWCARNLHVPERGLSVARMTSANRSRSSRRDQARRLAQPVAERRDADMGILEYAPRRRAAPCPPRRAKAARRKATAARRAGAENIAGDAR